MNADVSAAKREIDALAKSLAKISNINLESVVEDTGLNKASAAAQELQKHLQQAVNVNTGKLNLSAFNRSLQESNTSLS
jgi:triphosphoribosyl-dephospho-CoA synthetase